MKDEAFWEGIRRQLAHTGEQLRKVNARIQFFEEQGDTAQSIAGR